MISREQHFAGKIHAYTVPRLNPNSRVRELVDLYLLVESASLSSLHCVEALKRTFKRRSTHAIPPKLASPPQEWDLPFRAMAEECELRLDCQAAFETVSRFWTALSS